MTTSGALRTGRFLSLSLTARTMQCGSVAKGDPARERCLPAPFPPPALYLRVLSLLSREAEKLKQTQACSQVPIHLSDSRRAHFMLSQPPVLQSCVLCSFSTESRSQARPMVYALWRKRGFRRHPGRQAPRQQKLRLKLAGSRMPFLGCDEFLDAGSSACCSVKG